MSKFDENKYKSEYAKSHYIQCRVLLKPQDDEILTEYSQITKQNKSTLLKLCLKYCYENMIDVSELKQFDTNK